MSEVWESLEEISSSYNGRSGWCWLKITNDGASRINRTPMEWKVNQHLVYILVKGDGLVTRDNWVLAGTGIHSFMIIEKPLLVI